MRITMENYEEVKKEMERFEKEQAEEIHRAQEKKRLDNLYQEFIKAMPSHIGYLCYPTKVVIHIDYAVSTSDYQGRENRHTDVEMPIDIYDRVFDFKHN